MLRFNFIYIAIILPGYKIFGEELTNLDTIQLSSPGQIRENWDFLCKNAPEASHLMVYMFVIGGKIFLQIFAQT